MDGVENLRENILPLTPGEHVTETDNPSVVVVPRDLKAQTGNP